MGNTDNVQNKSNTNGKSRILPKAVPTSADKNVSKDSKNNGNKKDIQNSSQISAISDAIMGNENIVSFTKERLNEVLENYRLELIKELEFKEKLNKAENAISAPSNVIANMQAWLKRVSFKEFVDTLKKWVIGQEDLEDILFNVYMYIYNTANRNTISNNILLAAPSGCGKTETYRALRAYFLNEIPGFPITQADITGITPDGYAGGNIVEIVEPLRESGGIGLVFLDEFDKCMIPKLATISATFTRGVQSALLTLIEGRRIESVNVDTNQTMFIGTGSFDIFREKRENDTKSIGFSNVKEKDSDLHYKPISMDDLRNQGALPEMLGRFVTIINYHKLSDEAINGVIDKTLRRLADSFGMPIMLSKETREQLHKLANSEYGCRLIHNALHNRIVRTVKQYLYEGRKINEIMLYIESL